MAASSHYDFTTQWVILAPLDQVWEVLNAPDDWPRWWRGVERVELLKPGLDAVGRGAVRRYTWRSRLPYRLTFVIQTT